MSLVKKSQGSKDLPKPALTVECPKCGCSVPIYVTCSHATLINNELAVHIVPSYSHHCKTGASISGTAA
jgi:hypothetical protein